MSSKDQEPDMQTHLLTILQLISLFGKKSIFIKNWILLFQLSSQSFNIIFNHVSPRNVGMKSDEDIVEIILIFPPKFCNIYINIICKLLHPWQTVGVKIKNVNQSLIKSSDFELGDWKKSKTWKVPKFVLQKFFKLDILGILDHCFACWFESVLC